ncbi:spermidine synthase domain protein [Mycobacterium ulcerans str. Harvey]|uniref:Spermidine synthase domain protein n=1 Tax=Mycobacterium ulcerans str. Harvey TaxID=1299332 RepID=A0ABN0R7E4_MYCUL|nr:spermidine synthase domain protein [Mycobacterium ulcerans str. Harvey]
MIRGAAATGIVNLVAAAVVSIFLLRQVVSTRQLAMALCSLLAALGLLVTLLVHARDIETTSRQELYADPIIAYRHTSYQEIVVTRRGNDLRLYLDGGYSSPPETSTATPKAWSTRHWVTAPLGAGAGRR